MSLGLNKTKRRIASVSSTRKITNAMELIATVKLKKFKQVLDNNTRYSEEIFDMVSFLCRQKNQTLALYQQDFDVNGDLILVINSNLGLCAGYNTNIFKFVDENVKAEDTVFILGEKGLSHYRNLGKDYMDASEFVKGLDVTNIKKLSNYLLEEFLKGKYKNVKLIYTHYVNSITFVPSSFTLLPIASFEEKDNADWPPLFEPNIDEIISTILPLYLNTEIYQKLIESNVSEQASRRNAMDNATDSADDLLEKLTLEYNKARQASITNEITEVTSASNAQK